MQALSLIKYSQIIPDILVNTRLQATQSSRSLFVPLLEFSEKLKKRWLLIDGAYESGIIVFFFFASVVLNTSYQLKTRSSSFKDIHSCLTLQFGFSSRSKTFLMLHFCLFLV